MIIFPTVSVIIPTYNRKEDVQEAIDSVLAQTYTDYEIIVIDDGSTDGTGEALRERYGALLGERIRYEWQENQGRSAARNRGIELARGKYIAFLDSDDLWMPWNLARQVSFLEAQSDVGLVACGAILIDAEGSAIGMWCPWESQPELNLEGCLAACPLAPSMVLIRRRALDDLDHWFDPALPPAEDTDLFLRLLLAGCRMAWVKESVVLYRQHPGNSQGNAAGYARARKRLYEKLFARADFPADLAAQRSRILAEVQAGSAARCYAAGEYEVAQACLREAAALAPEGHEEGVFLERILRYGESPLVFLNEEEYWPKVLANLPPELDSSRVRQRALARVAMAKVFGAAGQGDWATVRRYWWQGVWRDPRWLKNWGVWVLGARATLAWSRKGVAS